MAREDTLERLRRDAPLITVGVLAADVMNLGREIEAVEQAGVTMLHFDVMDGRFCPSLTFGPAFVRGVKTKLLKDVHLMIEEPLSMLESFVAGGADLISINLESCRHIDRVLQVLGQMENVNCPGRGILRGVVLNPGTPVEALRPLLEDLEFVLLLAVNPGWGGQGFIPSTKAKLTRLRELLAESERDVLVGVDGGIKKDNIADVAAMGAELIVTGSAVFDGKDPAGNARDMLDAIGKQS